MAAAMVLRRPLPRNRFSILYVPKGPILNYKNPALRRVVLAQLEQIAQKERAIFIKIDPGVIKAWGSDDERKSPVGAKFIEELKARDWRYSNDQIQYRNTVELDLDRSEDDILASMKQKTRYNIRLAARKGVAVRMGSPADFKGMLAFVAQHQIKPVIDSVRPLEEVGAAFRHLDAARQMGKVVLTI